MNKALKIILIILAVVAVVLGVGVFVLYNMIMGDNVDPAYLNVESGAVQVDQGSGWKDAADGMKLSLNDKVKTLDGVASVVFYESIIVELDKSTEISIKTLAENKVAVKQESGSTWNKFTSIFGVKGYEVETPTTVATVRGTEFGVDVGEEESILVGEGTVGAKSEGEEKDVNEFQKLLKKKGEKFSIAQMSPEELQKILQKTKKNVERLKLLREKLIESKRDMIQKAMETYGAEEGQLREYLDKIDKGEVDDAELIEKSPVKIPAIYRFKRINDEIKRQNKIIEKIQEHLGSQ